MEPYRNTRVLITGATGFVGGRLAERLVLEEGSRVRCLVRAWPRAVWLSRTAAELFPGDVLDADAVRRAAEGCELVFHCASGPADDGGYTRTNLDGTRNVLEAARAAGARRVVYVSSVAVHGVVSAGTLSEQSPRPILGRDYSDSKVRAEELVERFSREHGLSCVILRPTYVWGPRSALFTARQLRDMRQGRFAYVNGGAGACHAVYIENLVDALLLAGLAPAADGGTFLVADGHGLTWRAFFGCYAAWLGLADFPSLASRSLRVRAMASALDLLNRRLDLWKGSPAPLYRRAARRLARIARDHLQRRGAMSRWDLEKYAARYDLDLSAARQRLGYAPRYGMEEAMAETRQWVVDQMGAELGLAPAEGPAPETPWVTLA